MRYENSEKLLQLAQRMQSSSDGVTLQDIQEQFDVVRRTAERMRSAVIAMFPEVEEFTDGDRIKRWRLRSSSLMRLSHVSVDELADLQNAINVLQKHDMSPQSERLENLLYKIKGTIKQQESIRMETDLEALLESEGHLTYAGPKSHIDTNVLSVIRDAIKSNRKITMYYTKRYAEQAEKRTIAPYGLLYGNRHYLVGWCDKADDIRQFLLANITNIKLTDEYFEQNSDFDLQVYNEQSFGVYAEKNNPMHVKWKFIPSTAKDLKNHTFHPKETRETLPDGSVVVSFTASGVLEMCWYLFRWGNYVEILEPQELKDQYREMLESVLGNVR